MDTRRINIESMSFFLAATFCFMIILFFSWDTYSNSTEFINVKLQTRINPNIAHVGSLMRLPNIGIGRACAIINYRVGYSEGKQVFNTTSDIEKVKGIGSKTAKKLEQYLTFEQDNNGRLGDK